MCVCVCMHTYVQVHEHVCPVYVEAECNKIVLLLLLLLWWYVICISEHKHMCGMLCMRTSEDTFHDNDFLSPQVAKMGLRETGLHGKCFYCKTILLIFLTSKHQK